MDIQPITEKKYLPIGTLVLGGLFVLIMLVTYILIKPSPPPPDLQGVLRTEFRQLKPFELTGNNGRIVSEKDFQGKWSFVFFGYLSCPDICPTTLQSLNSVQDLLEEDEVEDPTNTQVIFVSVDPQRDTVDTLTNYVTYFNRKFVGATADKNTIDNFSHQFAAGYVLEPETAPGQYLVSHTSAIFLVDPRARLVASMSWPHYPSTITSQYKEIKSYITGGG